MFIQVRWHRLPFKDDENLFPEGIGDVSYLNTSLQRLFIWPVMTLQTERLLEPEQGSLLSLESLKPWA